MLPMGFEPTRDIPGSYHESWTFSVLQTQIKSRFCSEPALTQNLKLALLS